MPTRIIIAAQTSLACQIFSRALTGCGAQFQVVGCAQTSEGLVKAASENHPDVALVSSELEDRPQGWLAAFRQLGTSGLAVHPILVLEKGGPELVIDAFSAGAKGVIRSTDPFESICKCIRCVAEGQVWASSQELQWVLKALTDSHPFPLTSVLGNPLLTPRQEEVVRMVVEGLPNGEISSKLCVSPHTIKNHLFRIYEKLGVSTRVELVLYAMSRRELT